MHQNTHLCNDVSGRCMSDKKGVRIMSTTICMRCGKEFPTEERKFYAYRPVCPKCHEELMLHRKYQDTQPTSNIDVSTELTETRKLLENLFEKTIKVNEEPKTHTPFTQECAVYLHKAVYTLSRLEREVSK